MILTADVYRGLEALWDASAAARLVPGGLWEGRPSQDSGSGQDTAAGLYAVLQVEEGEPQFNSGAAYVATFTAQVTVWSAAGAVATGAIQAALWSVLNRDRAANLAVRGARTLDARPLPGALEKEAPKKDARDVLAARQRWELTLQGTI